MALLIGALLLVIGICGLTHFIALSTWLAIVLTVAGVVLVASSQTILRR